MRLRNTSLLTALALASAAHAQVTVTDPWVRGTIAEQRVTGAFMTLSSPSDAKLLEVKSAAAGSAEIHAMRMENNMMTMRSIGAIDLPARTPVELKPGGYHVMLFDLKQPLKAGDSVPLTLVFEGKDKKRETVEVKATVRALGAPAMPMDHKH